MLEQAKAYWEKKDYQKAVSWYEQALPLVEKELGSDNPQLVALLLALGIGQHLQGHDGRALPFFQRSLDIIKNSPAMKDRDSAAMAALKGLGLCYLAQEDYRQAAPTFEDALAIEERILPADHTNLCATIANIARSYNELKDYNRALHYYDRALAIMEKHPQEMDHPEGLIAVLTDMGLTYRAMERRSEAAVAFQRCLQVQERAFGKDSTNCCASLKVLGDLHATLANY